MFALPLPALSVARSKLMPALQVREGAQILFDNEDHVTAATAVAAVRPATRYELLPAERYCAVAAGS